MRGKLKRKEILAAVILGTVVALSAIYVNVRREEQYSGMLCSLKSRSSGESYQTSPSSGETQQSLKMISETIEGELKRGAFEYVVDKLEILTEEMNGYVKSLHMTYQEKAWTGFMICKVPPSNVTSFTFGAREIIDKNGTVTYINISVESVEQGHESTYSTISFKLMEVKPGNGVEIGAMLTPILSILTTSLWWIAQGLIIGIPLCFASLGIVILVNRGIIPLWKNTLKKPK